MESTHPLSARPAYVTYTGGPQSLLVQRPQPAPPLGALSANAQRLLAHWRDVAGARIMPQKNDIQPETLGRVLKHILIYEYHDQDHIQIRLAGSSFRAIHGRELTGTNFLDLAKREERQKMSDRLHAQLKHPCGLFAMSTTGFASGSTGYFQAFGLPLADETGTPRFSIHVSEYLSGDALPSFGGVTSSGATSAKYVDIGAGIPDFEPPY